MIKPQNVKPGVVKLWNFKVLLDMSICPIIKYKISGRFHLGGKTLLKTGNTGLKRVIRKMYEYCVKLRKVKCYFSNRIKMI